MTMNEDLRRANELLAANRRLHDATRAVLTVSSIPELDNALVDVIPGATGFGRVALLSLPSAKEPSQVLRALGYPALNIDNLPKGSPLRAGGICEHQTTGSEDDDELPHGDVRGYYALAPLRDRERVVALLYADSLSQEAEPSDSFAAMASILEIAGIVRTNLMLVADRDRLLTELSSLARTDSLTGLPNRRVFEERLETEVMRGARTRRSFALAILDIDHFKEINDRHGHAAGDEALRRFARVLASQVRNADFAARFAGDEFVMIFVDVERETVAAAVDRLLEILRGSDSGPCGRLSASAGVAISFPVDTAETLMERADNALYAAKHAGRDRAMFL